MKIKIYENLRDEILLTLKNGVFEVTNDSKLCGIFEIDIRYFDVFETSRNIALNRKSKIELLEWLAKGHIETNDSLFSKAITPPTFLEIMILASQVD
jgi:hypothetical protein